MHVFPIRSFSNDPEGFGTVAVEAAAFGAPTVAYADVYLSGCLVNPGDSEAFSLAVLDLPVNRISIEMIRGFAKEFSRNNFGERIYGAVEDAN
jgi:phosphatidyl-myo-inositol dimannoside synthase